MAELQKRILAYADSLKSRGDISPERFGAAIGVGLTRNEEEGVIENAGHLTVKEGYNYVASYFPAETPSDFPIHSVRFYRQGKPSVTLVPDGVCFWDAGNAGRALEKLGYSGGSELPFQRGGMRVYSRAISGGKQEMSASLLTYPLEESKAGKICVYEIRFRGGDV